jgi:hypothetical protein
MMMMMMLGIDSHSAGSLRKKRGYMVCSSGYATTDT